MSVVCICVTLACVQCHCLNYILIVEFRTHSHTHTPTSVRFNGGDRGLCEWVYGKERPLSVCPLAGLRETHTIKSLEHHSACAPLAVGLSEVFSVIK